MSITFKVDKFVNDPDDNTKKIVGLRCTDSKGAVFIVDKKITIADGKTDESYVQDAYNDALSEINEWFSGVSVEGKVFNPSDNSLSDGE